MKNLKCDMKDECKETVTHLDDDGFIYCEHHGKRRQMYRRCRKMRTHEINRLKKGLRIKKY